MIIMMTVVAVAIGLSVLIINQFQFSANLDHAAVAYYAAETGLEEGLMVIKDSRDKGTEKINDAITKLNNNTGGSINGASWDISDSTLSQEYWVESLEQNKTTSFTVENGGSMILNWIDDCDKASWVEINYIPYNNNGQLSKDNPPVRVLSPCSDAPPCKTDPQTINFPNSNLNYAVTIMPIYCDISNLKVKAYDADEGGGNQIDLGNRIYLKSVGTFHGSKIALAASIPYRLPPQGIFNFVLFSEKTIEKK